MKRFLNTLAIAFICGVLIVPMAEASERREGNNGGGRTEHSSGGNRGGNRGGNSGGERGNRGGDRGGNRGGNSGNNGSNRGDNPGNKGGNPGGDRGGNRGGNPGNKGGNPGGNRGGNPGNKGGNPGGNRGGNPGHNPGNRGGNPGHNPGDRGGNPGRRPGGDPGRRPGRQTPPPGRPRAYRHPHPNAPRGWMPGPRAPRFTTIFGLTIGTAFDLSFDLLYNAGYNVYSYGDNVIYLSDVTQLNYLWPSAALHYTSGRLASGEYFYSTTNPDPARYNGVYNALVNAYGAPVGTVSVANGMGQQWFGPDGRYVVLQYQPMYDTDGVYRYYTTLSFGM